MTIDGSRKWWALVVLCLGSLMFVLDTTIVNVALPTIKTDLGFTDASLAWVVNAYLLSFGGFLLLGGRLGDLYGHRRLFLAGITVFTLASLVCGLAQSQEVLIVARAIQGFGGAVYSAIALSLVMILFQEPAERAKAMGVFGFVAAGGGAIGVVLGGLLTGAFDWHWIFLINVPIGILVFIATMFLVPASRGVHTHLDVWGAITITASLLLAIYAIVNGNATGWASTQTVGLLIAAVVLLGIFFFIESRHRSPLIPLRFLGLRNLATANVMGMLWAAAMFAWFFIAALYLQLVLHYTPLQVGLAFLPSNLIMAVFSAWLSAKIVMRFGIKLPLAFGLGCAAIGLLLFGFAPVDGLFLIHVLPGMLLLGLGAGIAFNPMLLVAMGDVEPQDSGLASGIVNTAFMMGGALGLAILASLAGARTSTLLAGGADQTAALTGGYHLAFFLGALSAALAAVLGVLLLRPKPMSPEMAQH